MVNTLLKQIEQLEKENAELKERNRGLDAMLTGESLVSNERKEQLTNAKDLLKKWVELFKPKGVNIPPTPIQVDTEQFLKDLEK